MATFSVRSSTRPWPRSRVRSSRGNVAPWQRAQLVVAGDLVGGAVDLQLCQHRPVGVVHRREQVHRAAVGADRATQALAVHRDRTPTPWAGWPPPVGQPRTDRGVQRIAADPGQGATQRRLAGGVSGSGQRIPAGAERDQDRLGRVSGPFADRGQGSGAGQHRRGGHGQHAHQRVPQASAVTRVRDHGEAFQQARALTQSQRRSIAELGQDRRDRR